jgi:hypothetical protein
MKKTKAPFTPQIVAPPVPGPDAGTLASFTDALEELNREFEPHLTVIRNMASRAIVLQTEIYTRKLAEHYPFATVTKAPVIVTFSARDPLTGFQQILAALAKDSIEVAAVNYDPKTFTFTLYGKS